MSIIFGRYIVAFFSGTVIVVVVYKTQIILLLRFYCSIIFGRYIVAFFSGTVIVVGCCALL